MRRGWQTWLLLLVMITIFWVLVLPNVDLDPAPPLNPEVLLFALFAFCLGLLASKARCGRGNPFVAVYLLSRPPSIYMSARLAPLRC